MRLHPARQSTLLRQEIPQSRLALCGSARFRRWRRHGQPDFADHGHPLHRRTHPRNHPNHSRITNLHPTHQTPRRTRTQPTHPRLPPTHRINPAHHRQTQRSTPLPRRSARVRHQNPRLAIVLTGTSRKNRRSPALQQPHHRKRSSPLLPTTTIKRSQQRSLPGSQNPTTAQCHQTGHRGVPTIKLNRTLQRKDTSQLGQVHKTRRKPKTAHQRQLLPLQTRRQQNHHPHLVPTP